MADEERFELSVPLPVRILSRSIVELILTSKIDDYKRLYIRALEVVYKYKKIKNSSISTAILSSLYIQNTYIYCELYCKLLITLSINKCNTKDPLIFNNNYLLLVVFLLSTFIILLSITK